MTDRERIVVALQSGPLSTQEIAAKAGLGTKKLSARLSELACAGVVRRAGARNTRNPKGGRSTIIWSLEPAPAAPGLRRLPDTLRRAVLAAVAGGAETAGEVVAAAGLDPLTVLGVALGLRGDGERPVYLCCADGMPWALTQQGAALLEVLR